MCVWTVEKYIFSVTEDFFYLCVDFLDSIFEAKLVFCPNFFPGGARANLRPDLDSPQEPTFIGKMIYGTEFTEDDFIN